MNSATRLVASLAFLAFTAAAIVSGWDYRWAIAGFVVAVLILAGDSL